jgi:lipopolysaccharide export system protein LptA
MHQTVNKALATLLLLLTTQTIALHSDQTLPYHIRSDNMQYNRNTHQTIYRGHVIATQGTTRISGNKLIVSTSPKTHRLQELIAYGNLAHYATLPDGQAQKLHAVAKVIKYWPGRQKAELIRDARVTQEQNIFTGQKIWYDIKNQSVYTDHHANTGQTTIIIQPTDHTS